MADTVSSPNMSMPVPVVGTDPGPQWATDLNSCLGILDQHDHSPGLGVQITPNGLNINSALTMSGNFLTSVAGVTLSAQLTPPADGTLYLSGNDLYYVDGVGNNIRLTQSGSVAGSAGTITGLPSGTASASYSTGTFVFQSATNTGAVIDGGSFILRNNSALSKGLTLSPPNAMGADYSLVLPALPSSTKFLSLDSIGNISAVWAADNTTLEISTNSLQIKAGGVGTTQLADSGVSQPKLYTRSTGASVAAGNVGIAGDSGTFTTTSGTPVQVTGQTVTLVTTGRPVILMLVGLTTAPGAFGNDARLSNAGTSGADISILRNGTDWTTDTIARTELGGASIAQMTFPVLQWIDTPAAGTQVYHLFASSNAGVVATAVNHLCLVAFEIN